MGLWTRLSDERMARGVGVVISGAGLVVTIAGLAVAAHGFFKPSAATKTVADAPAPSQHSASQSSTGHYSPNINGVNGPVTYTVGAPIPDAASSPRAGATPSSGP